MLYDPAPLNDLGDPGWDMSAYEAYSSGGQTFTYRRQLEGVGNVTSGSSSAIWLPALEGEGQQITTAGQQSPAGDVAVTSVSQAGQEGRQLASATEADWRNRMVFYDGDERDFYQVHQEAEPSPLA